MTQRFDLIVVGTGAAASPVASKCRRAGWSVAIVDARPYGGTCALRGCDPKRALLGAAEAVEAIRRLSGKGVEAGRAAIRWHDLMEFKRSFTQPVPEHREQSFARKGITTLHGRARFVAPRSLEVDGERLEARYVHIAAGAKPMHLGIDGEDHLTTSDDFLELDHLPPRVLFLGSGYISFELAHLASLAGARVTMLERLDRPLGAFDPDLVSLLSERSRAMEIDLRLGTTVEAVEPAGGAYTVRAAREGERTRFQADLVVHGAGRTPAIDDLDLEAAGVEADPRRGVIVNDYMQSVSNPAVYAAGDAAAAGPPLTPVASFEAQVVAANLLEGNHRTVDYPPIPSVVFTMPPLASVGLQESEARELGLRFEARFTRTSSWFSARRVGERFSGYKLLLGEDDGRILGAHLLGPKADEVINLFAMAIRCGMTGRDLKKMIFAYPTSSSDLSYMV